MALARRCTATVAVSGRLYSSIKQSAIIQSIQRVLTQFRTNSRTPCPTGALSNLSVFISATAIAGHRRPVGRWIGRQPLDGTRIGMARGREISPGREFFSHACSSPRYSNKFVPVQDVLNPNTNPNANANPNPNINPDPLGSEHTWKKIASGSRAPDRLLEIQHGGLPRKLRRFYAYQDD